MRTIQANYLKFGQKSLGLTLRVNLIMKSSTEHLDNITA